MRLEKMVVDKLYPCIHEDKVFLFYKDEQDILYCYEVDDVSAQKEIFENPEHAENILSRHAGCD